MKGLVYNNGELAGVLEKRGNNDYRFRYTDEYYYAQSKPSISLSLTKKQQEYRSDHLFAFFYGMLAEGALKEIQCSSLKIDEDDDFTRLLETAQKETIGAITIKPEGL